MSNLLTQFIKPKKRQRKVVDRPNPRCHGTPYSSEKYASQRPIVEDSATPLEQFLAKRMEKADS